MRNRDIPAGVSWTAEEIDTAKKMWREGRSASESGAALGKSRNSILGYASRNRQDFASRTREGDLRRDNNKLAKAPKAAKPKAEKPAAKPKQVWATRSADIAAARARADAEAAETRARLEDDAVAEPDGVIVPIFRRVPLIKLTERSCKWLLGDPVKADFAFCGNDAPGKSPYCAFHQRLAYQPKAGAA